MKRVLFVSLLVFFSMTVFSQNEEQINKNLQLKYLTFLKTEGFTPSVDNDGDVMFKYEGNTYYIRPMGSVNKFKLSYYLSSDKSNQLNKLLDAANEVMKDYYNIIITVSEDKKNDKYIVIYSVDNFFANENDYEKFLYRCLTVIQNATKDYQGKM